MPDDIHTKSVSRRNALRGGAAVAVAGAATAVFPSAAAPDQTYRQRMLTFADELAKWLPDEKYCIVQHRQKMAKVVRVLADWPVDERIAGGAA